MGASTQTFGGLCQWLTNVFNIITGNFDSEGGAMFPQPAFDLIRDRTEAWPKNFIMAVTSQEYVKLPFFNGEFPVATLADEILPRQGARPN